ncbi:MAG TPA: DUF1501 domain-containing protein [Pirellulales bacterium]
MNSSRRKFLATLAGGSAVISLSGRVPHFLAHAAAAELDQRKDTILVVVQLTGGNDGLNTVIPYSHDAYRKARPKLAIAAKDVLKINDSIGLHPSARGLSELLQAGKLAIVQGVGYSSPNRSHFESMDIWHTCLRKGNPRTTGWLGRFLDASHTSTDVDAAAIHIGLEKQPLALATENVRVSSFGSPESFRLEDGGSRKFRDAIRALTGTDQQPSDPLLGFLQTSTTSALSTSERIAEVLRDYQTPVAYPESAFASRLKTIAQLINAGLKTRVYYVELDGFDTHSQQAAAHAALLQQFGGAVRAFIEDIEHHGHGERTLVMSFSEFGRRVAENASEGTDHGAAAPMFVAGSRVGAGLVGDHPSFDDLEDGDLKFHTDFRQVYATLLQNWLGWPSAAILGGEFSAIDLVKA